MLSISESTELCRVLADTSRQRLLMLLKTHALSATEITEVTGLAQSRVSTHLARLKRAHLVRIERTESPILYSACVADGPAAELWRTLSVQLDDGQMRADIERATQVLAARQGQQTWAESVAGRMDRHYSPGRTWEATARALIEVLNLGTVLDIASGDGVFAELIAPHCQQLTCVDISPTVLAAAQRRLASAGNVQFQLADMHQLPMSAGSFSTVFGLHALPFSAQPAQLLAEIYRVLKPGGSLILATIAQHKHAEIVKGYNHCNLGFSPEQVRGFMTQAGFRVNSCAVSSQENRAPYFEIITAVATR